MNTYSSMIQDIDKIIERFELLSLEEGELFHNEMKKRLEYMELLMQVKKTKESFHSTFDKESSKPVSVINDSNKSNFVYGTTSITENDIRFGLLRFSKISDISKSLQPNSKILIKFKGDSYQGSIPKSVPGRINGLATLFKEHEEILAQRKVTAQYDYVNKIMTIE